MSSLSRMEARLPPGFRFHPRDEELISDYLAEKVSSGNGNGFPTEMMIDVDLNTCEPWDLPEVACVGGKEWYFCSLRYRKYATGPRTNRATASGFWKATGKDQPVVDPRRRDQVVGMRKTLVFYQGRASRGKKTDWVMHEFRLAGRPDGCTSSTTLSSKEAWVLCKVFHKSRGLPPKSRMEGCCNHTRPSLFPPLTDTFMNVEQAGPSLEGCEHVPFVSSHHLIRQPQHQGMSSSLHNRWHTETQ